MSVRSMFRSSETDRSLRSRDDGRHDALSACRDLARVLGARDVHDPRRPFELARLLSMVRRTSVMLARMSSSWEELGPATFA